MSWIYECDDEHKVLKVHVFPTSEALDLLCRMKEENIFNVSHYRQAILEYDSKEAPLILVAMHKDAKYQKILVDAGFIGDHSYTWETGQFEWDPGSEFSVSYTIGILELFGFHLLDTQKDFLRNQKQLGDNYCLHLQKGRTLINQFNIPDPDPGHIIC